jgi:fluoride ion exporter CrcB/FEX
MNLISVVFFGVSVISLVVQILGLSKMVPPEPSNPVIQVRVQHLVRQGMIRTAACRVLAAMTYVALSAFLLIYGDIFPIASLAVFIAVQIMWQMNALADVILRRRLETEANSFMWKHRKQINVNLKVYAKAGVQLQGAVLVAVLPLLSTDTPLGASEWVNVALVAVGAAVVWNTQNHPDWPYGKLIGSALVTALTTLNSFLSDGLTRAEIMQIVLALVVTIAVGGFPNAAKEVEMPVSNMNPEGKSVS